jgi:hypothetical protein
VLCFLKCISIFLVVVKNLQCPVHQAKLGFSDGVQGELLFGERITVFCLVLESIRSRLGCLNSIIGWVRELSCPIQERVVLPCLILLSG